MRERCREHQRESTNQLVDVCRVIALDTKASHGKKRWTHYVEYSSISIVIVPPKIKFFPLNLFSFKGKFTGRPQ